MVSPQIQNLIYIGTIIILVSASKSIDLIIPSTANETRPQKYIELLIVTDRALLKEFGYDHQKLRTFIQTHVNIQNQIFLKLGFHHVIIGHVQWAENNGIQDSDSIEDHLKTLGEYAPNYLYPEWKYDSVQLISGLPFPDTPGTGGMSFVGTTCRSPPNAVSVIQYSSQSSSLMSKMATITAHELGHTVGIRDEYYVRSGQGVSNPSAVYCRSGCADTNCVMNWQASAATTTWTQCSRDAVKIEEDKGMYSCTYNKPFHRISNNSYTICGNGVVEQPEQCDCSLNDAVCLVCCNQTSCTYKASATCSGSCCLNCTTIAPVNTICRKLRPLFDCDQEDTCDGISDQCMDKIIPDGSECKDSDKWCQFGSCIYKCPNNCNANIAENEGLSKCVKRAGKWQCECNWPYKGTSCGEQYSKSLIIAFGFIATGVGFCLTCCIMSCWDVEKKIRAVPQV